MMKNSKAKTRLLKEIARGIDVQSSIHAKRKQHSADLVDELKRHALIEGVDSGVLKLTAEGKSYLRRAVCEERDPYQAQHRSVREIKNANGQSVAINISESPIAKLYNRKVKDGKRMVTKAQFEAAERLRRDFETAQLSPKLGMSLTPKVDGGPIGGDVYHLHDKALQARKRLDRISALMGREMTSLLLDVCCFLKGLELVEREREWPARSAKVVLKVSLSRLADFYGLSEEAIGKSTCKQKTSVWHAD